MIHKEAQMGQLMSDSQAAVEVFKQAAELNRQCELLDGAVLRFPDYGQLVMTGDLHGHWRNFEKLRRFCDLERAPVRHVILHELIHEEPASMTEPDMSHLMLLAAAHWKCDYPDQVHFLQSNHELSQITGHQITKGGRIVNHDFECGVEATYGADADTVLEAMMEFMVSYALAGRTPNRIFVSHSLPGSHTIHEFVPADLDRAPTIEELGDHATAYAMVWGRHQDAKLLESLAQMLDVDLFICGHQPQEEGFEVLHERMLILASDHNHGMFLPLDLRKPLNMADLTRLVRRFAAVE